MSRVDPIRASFRYRGVAYETVCAWADYAHANNTIECEDGRDVSHVSRSLARAATGCVEGEGVLVTTDVEKCWAPAEVEALLVRISELPAVSS